MNQAELDKAVGELAQAQSSEEFEKIAAKFPELLNEEVIGLIFALSEKTAPSVWTNRLFKVAVWLRELKNFPKGTLKDAVSNWETVKPMIRASTVGWARAARRYLALCEDEFIRKAISDARESGEVEIADFLQSAADNDEEEVFLKSEHLVRALQSAGRDEESLTIDLINLDFHCQGIETFADRRADERTLAFNGAVQACTEAVRVSRFLNDRECEAFYLAMMANGFFSARRNESAIEYSAKAVEKYRRLVENEPEENEPKLAFALNILATTQAGSKRFEQAFDAFSETLEIRRRLALRNPAEYERALAITLCNVGEARRVATDYGEAIESLAAALTILRKLAADDDEETYEPEIAAVLNNLGNSQYALGRIEEAEVSYRESLEIRRKLAARNPARYERDVAESLGNLAAVLNSSENFEGAIKLFRQSLGIYRRLAAETNENYEPEIAVALNNLGETYREANRFDEAIKSFRDALEIRQKLFSANERLYAPEVAVTLNCLGNAQYESGRLREAVESFAQALKIRRKLAAAEPSVYEPDLAATLNSLGVAQRESRRFAAAITTLNESLEIRRKLAEKHSEAFEFALATTLNSLGNAHNQSHNFEPAVDLFAESFEIMRRLTEKHPRTYRANFARVANSLGYARFDAGQYAAALGNYLLALEITQELAAEQWLVYEPDAALSLNNIGNALRKLGRADEAIEAFSQSLEKYRRLIEVQPQVYEPFVALALNNLGETEREIRRFGPAVDSLSQALRLARKLAASEPQVYEPLYAGLLNNLGSAQYEAGNVERAVADYAESLRIRQKLAAENPQVYELEAAGTLTNLGILYADERKWETALDYFERGRAIIENSLYGLLDIARRKKLFQEYAHLFGGLLKCLFEAGDRRKALEIAEQGKSRTLSDLLALKTVRPQFSREETPTDEQLAALSNLAESYENAVVRGQQLESSLFALYQDRATLPRLLAADKSPKTVKIREKKAMLEKEIAEQEKQKAAAIARRNESLREIQIYDRRFPPKAELLTEEQIFALSRKSNRVIVHLRVDEKETFAFVVFPDGDFQNQSVNTFDFQKLSDFTRRWFAPYFAYQAGDKDLISTRKQLSQFVEQMEFLLAELYADLLQPVRKILKSKKYRDILFVPSGTLTVLPLHAACWNENGTTRYLLDEFTISYATSVSVFKKAWENAENRVRRDNFLFVTNPERDLESADAEADEIIKSFGLLPSAFRDFRHGEAVKEKVKAEMNNAYGFYHFSCHGRYNWHDPFSSPLFFADARLLLKEVMETDASSVWLTTLSACETGLVDFKELTDEHYGFPLAFIFAGCPSVWATIWSVDAASSAELMRRAYSHLKNGAAKADALRQAQIDYRYEKRNSVYASPYFWAGFQHYGV